ncbi:hypothetical protein E2C01_057038 [Portunus trituberculatus]|uniref:Uncharacterized protein n=1 Tax=Portunus trituberculatus TaxID=210409 RepID=A0A5B7H0R1_PORTR|nr:hypothetical protein [Portunus trituberculatus]
MGEITTSTLPQWTYIHVRDRRAQTLLARLRIGHTYLTQRYLLTTDPQPYCDDCLVPLTVRHILVECHYRYLYRCLATPNDLSRCGALNKIHPSSRDRSAMVAPVVSVQPSVTPSVLDRASCDEDGLSMETSDDIVTAVPRGPVVSKGAVQPDLRLPMTGRSYDGSHHSPVGRKAAVQRPGTSQLPVSSRRLIISSQVCHGQSIQKSRPSTAPK